MPEDVLKRLLEAERRAEAIVESARTEQARLIDEARREARALEQGFEARVPGIRALHVKDAEERAERAIAELERRFHERQKELRRLAEAREDDAVRDALGILTSPERCE